MKEPDRLPSGDKFVRVMYKAEDVARSDTRTGMVLGAQAVHFLFLVGLPLLVFSRATSYGTTDAYIANFIIFGGLYLAFNAATKIQSKGNNLVLVNGQEYTDIGPGNLYIGVGKWIVPILSYSPKESIVTLRDIELGLRAGQTALVNVSYSWRPDREELDEYFGHDNVAEYVQHMTVQGLHVWSIDKTIQDLWNNRVIEPERIPGVLQSSITFSNIELGSVDMSQHVTDADLMLAKIVNTVKSEELLAQKRAELEELFPERTKSIESLINNRAARLRQKANSE